MKTSKNILSKTLFLLELFFENLGCIYSFQRSNWFTLYQKQSIIIMLILFEMFLGNS